MARAAKDTAKDHDAPDTQPADTDSTHPDIAAAVIEAGRAQALAMAVVDAAAQLRRTSTVSVAAIALALEKILAGQAEAGEAALEATEKTLDRAVDRLRKLVEMTDTP